MATVKPASVASQTAIPQSAQTGAPLTALASPYDGTNPLAGSPINGVAGPVGMGAIPGALSSGTSPQLNATNQTALAPNGDVNQHVTNDNSYVTKYYNIIVPNSAHGGWGALGGVFGSWNTPGNTFIDPQTGVMYVQQEPGFMGWLKRLFRGY